MVESAELKARLGEAARELGFDLFGTCRADPPESLSALRLWLDEGFAGTMGYMERSFEMRSDLRSLLPEVQSVIAVGMNCKQTNVPVPGRPRIATYALGRDYHKTIRSKLKRLARTVSDMSPGAVSRACVDSAPILEREYGQRAGLGWFGKNTCLINSHRGSFFMIGVVLTSVELEPSRPSAGGCGTCSKCIEACPTGAIVPNDGRWQIDARRCVSYLTIEHRGSIDPELATQMGDCTFGFDLCQDVCPFNEARPSQPLRGQPTRDPDFLDHKEFPSLLELTEMSQERWDVLTTGSALRRAGFQGIKRNARINLENAQDPSHGAQRRK